MMRSPKTAPSYTDPRFHAALMMCGAAILLGGLWMWHPAIAVILVYRSMPSPL
jgi:hypothetical protein